MAFEFHSTAKCGAKLRISIIEKLIIREKRTVVSTTMYEGNGSLRKIFTVY
jgi:hypothetical protein